MSLFISEAPKSIPHAAKVADVYTLNDHGTAGAVTDQSPQRIDLEDLSSYAYHEGLALFEAKTTNGQGGTPTSPGAAATFTLKYAFSTMLIAAADAPTILQDLASSFVITLPDSNSSAAAGQRIHQSGDPFVVPGRYLYTWYDRDAFATNALVDFDIDLVRV